MAGTEAATDVATDVATDATSDGASGSVAPPKATAVVVIHGIGEQRPMDTLRGFAAAVCGPERRAYAVPDPTDVSYELHTLVVAAEGGWPRTDFYEGYWAPDVTGTRLAHVLRWTRRLTLRSPRRLPTRLRRIVVRVGVAVALLVAAVVWLGADVVDLLGDEDVAWWAAGAKVALAAGAAGVIRWITDHLGDAARYLDVHPRNVAQRQAIRARVVRLLDQLHEGGRYDRIVVVGHSLGGVIAYDAVRLLWRERLGDPDLDLDLDDAEISAAARALVDIVAAGGDASAERARFRTAQADVFAALAAAHPDRWLISDLITLGSPVAHAAWLLSDGGDDLAVRIRERELPTCPPQPAHDGDDAVVYHSGGRKRIHHGAVFASTRWSNGWFPGDPVGGPIRATGPLGRGRVERDAGLGAGVVDLGFTGRKGLIGGLRSHPRYWTDAAGRERVVSALALDAARVP